MESPWQKARDGPVALPRRALHRLAPKVKKALREATLCSFFDRCLMFSLYRRNY
jgi:hypothetical protein